MPPGLIGEPLQKKRPRQIASSYQPLVTFHPHSMSFVALGDIVLKETFDVAPSVALMTFVVQRRAHETIADKGVIWIPSTTCYVRKALCEISGGPVFA